MQDRVINNTSKVVGIIRADKIRWNLLQLVRGLRLPDCWIGAGFVRNAVWDHLHGRAPSPLKGDVDVIWFDPANSAADLDRRYEEVLRAWEPSVVWSVKNQARMHEKNGDSPYVSVADAMRHWPETATAVAVRRTDQDDCDVASPLGLDDLMGLVLRPTPLFAGTKRSIYIERLENKRWTASWPLLREMAA
ncbi:MAG: nucleotidyltransferase family protein [Alphaproteobacteria bacterium]